MAQQRPKYDTIILQTVPRVVDDVVEREKLRHRRAYWTYATGQVQAFLEDLAGEYADGVSENLMRRNQAAVYTCELSPEKLRIGFSPGYTLILDAAWERAEAAERKRRDEVISLTPKKKELVQFPTYDILFKDISRERSRRILEAVIDQFYFRYGERDEYDLRARKVHHGKDVQGGVELLSGYLPDKTRVQARTDDMFACGIAEYRTRAPQESAAAKSSLRSSLAQAFSGCSPRV